MRRSCLFQVSHGMDDVSLAGSLYDQVKSDSKRKKCFKWLVYSISFCQIDFDAVLLLRLITAADLLPVKRMSTLNISSGVE